MSERTRGYAHRVDTVASAEDVWTALTTSAALGEWCSQGAEIDAREGGWLRACVDHVTEFEAHIDVFRPPRRLRLIHLPSEAPPLADSTIIDDLVLDGGDTVTIVRVLGSGVPGAPAWDARYLRLRLGWERALARLKVYVERRRGAAREGLAHK